MTPGPPASDPCIPICIADLEQIERGLYAGAGIVEGSDPEKEMKETEMKLRALLDVLACG